ncbi:MAG TPA: hypothetical protein VIF82_10675 [Burkholderiaceae bacterium]|jgi:hypothetical protein
MEIFVFRTAIPFGYLIASAGFVALSILSVVLFFRGVLGKPRRTTLIVLSGVLMFFLVMVGVANLNEESIDWNPLVRNTSELTGTWQDGSSNLVLLSDGQYRCSGNACDGIDVKGNWQRSGDFYILFRPINASQVEWRLAMHAGRLSLASGVTKGDPDMWLPKLTFQRVLPNS